MSHCTRRDALRILAATPALALLGDVAPPGRTTGPAQGQVVRRSASAMTQEEIALFQHAFDLVVRDRTLDTFIAAHAHGDRQRPHEIVPGVTTLAQSYLMPYPGGERFLPWHRAFLLELEAAMQRAVRRELGEEAARRVFVPYWDATRDGRIPDWVAAYAPAGARAVVPEGLPPGHPATGRPGSEYLVRIERFPGTYPFAATPPRPDVVESLLAENDYTRFTRRVEWAPFMVRGAADRAEEVERAVQRLGDAGAPFAPLVQALRQGHVMEMDETPVLLALLSLERVPAGAPGELLQRELPAAFGLGTHLVLHAYAGGHAPDRPLVRGTCMYFHETVADPLFSMLHCEIDRLWATWQRRGHDETPALCRTRDTLFNPSESGRAWRLEELLAYDALPYRYEQLFGETRG